ncbi:hypothetical protein NPIL_423161 [Nephila pilipes]|uniref:Uncharacterized protein n=1 Tax=Nephila pilipes TaxID=299642 RepID=A0A8X6NBN1_NEPPI|nr:hypothetical protein NPIL_423161 [Nephila pilipes]
MLDYFPSVPSLFVSRSFALRHNGCLPSCSFVDRAARLRSGQDRCIGPCGPARDIEEVYETCQCTIRGSLQMGFNQRCNCTHFV